MMTPPKEKPIKFILFMNGLAFRYYVISYAAVLPITSKVSYILVVILFRTKK